MAWSARLLTAALVAGAAGGSVAAAGLPAPERADLERAYRSAALSSSEEPVVREERRTHEPSAGFLLGAALGAWMAASDQLDFDLKNPQAAGAPHASQGPANRDALEEDCRDERIAFDHLRARSAALDLAPAAVLAAVGLGERAGRWRDRQAAAPAGCAAAKPSA